ncbi:aldo/keto reductase [Neptunicella marina]|uniref:Aldo/keto reductase n=1 Tax=Neptunicella marina TaxID=2125989 RepID=A0A8J6IN64_9ALTE|nr:aldo/keto reductase [Neptunicella marina]MBC3765130.1 aldo/keto reductase [Neptunicella marina]
MQYVKLGSSGLDVSNICLGTMTWGTQNTQQDANDQMAVALEAGINFFDTAEMYSVPPNADSYGKTEIIIGNWLKANSDKRQDIVLATKIAGPGLSYIRDGRPVNGADLISAVDDSLKRLNTDYIDLYQIHWPNRTSPHFGKHWPGFYKLSDAESAEQSLQMAEILKAIDECIKQGKIRHWGLSNETPWGINQYLKLSEEQSLPRPVSIQNEFNLLHTKDWPYLIENCIHEEVAYLPWSPLAAGALSGKYADGQRPAGSRWTLVQRNGLFRDTPYSRQATQAYVDLAKQHNITPSQLALAWVKQVDGVSSTIIGATTIEQLNEDITAFNIELSDELQAGIMRIMQQYPVPF